MRTTTFALIFGIAYLAAGVLGLVPAALQPPPAGAPTTSFGVLYGYLLGLFPVNVLHTGVHLAIGLWGVAAWAGALSSVTYARSLALLYGVLAVMGIAPGLNALFGFVPLHGHDVWLHAGTAARAGFPGHAGDGNRALDADRHAVQRADLVAEQDRLVSPPRGGPGPLRIDVDERVQPRVEPLDPGEMGVDHFGRCHHARPDQCRERAGTVSGRSVGVHGGECIRDRRPETRDQPPETSRQR